MKTTNLRDSYRIVHSFLLLFIFAAFGGSTLAAPGDVDPEFNPDANGIVYCTALQTGGKIVVGGEFTTMNGVVRNRIARLNKDGTLDTGFDPGADNVVFSIALQSDGKAIVAGGFTNLGGMACGRIARLNPNGMPDSSFNPLGNASVRTVTVQSDGKIVIGGAFTSLGGVPRNRIARLNRDGTVEPGFNPDADGVVYSTAVDPAGNIIVRGDFSRVGGVARNRIARLNADGTLDPSFDPNISGVTFLGFSSLALQVDGKVLVGGDFTTVGGTARSYLARVNTDGTLDTGFNPNPDFDVLSIAVQTDGAIVIGGGFSMVGGMAHDSIAQISLNGTLSPGFTPTLNGSIRSIALQADGKVIIGGGFTSVSGAIRNRIARLQNYPATQSLEVVGRDVVRWLRAGASPEAQEVIFDLSVDKGATWTRLGAGTRIPSGWELVGLSLPSNGLIRASARVIGGFYDGTSGLIDHITSFPSSDNTAPTVTNPIADLIVNEDAVKTSIDLTTVFNDAETTASSLVFTVMTNTNPALMTATFATTANLTLTYATNASGTGAITVRATDIGGLQVEDTFVVTVNAVNDAPAVMFATNVVVLEKAAPHNLPGFAAFSPGPTDESNQRLLRYAVSNNNNEMFIVQPSIDDAGTLTFTPAPSAHSSAYITVIAQDDGGMANGGEDKTTKSFIISAIVDM